MCGLQVQSCSRQNQAKQLNYRYILGGPGIHGTCPTKQGSVGSYPDTLKPFRNTKQNPATKHDPLQRYNLRIQMERFSAFPTNTIHSRTLKHGGALLKIGSASPSEKGQQEGSSSTLRAMLWQPIQYRKRIFGTTV